MAVTRFVLELEIGNEAMRLPQHIADALVAVAAKLPHVAPMKGISSKILDANGNVCGKWEYK